MTAAYADTKYPGTGGIIVDTSDLLRLQSTLQGRVADKIKILVEEGIREIAAFLHSQIRANLAVRRYTLTELKEMGHPYARKNFGGEPDAKTGNLYLASSRGMIEGMEPYAVSRQSGKLLASLGWEMDNRPEEIRAIVGLSASHPEHARYVIMGTRFMVARDFLSYALFEHRDEMLEMFERRTGLKRK
jgi:hypothetical protein